MSTVVEKIEKLQKREYYNKRPLSEFINRIFTLSTEKGLKNERFLIELQEMFVF
jgi:hypothetical protein